MYSRRRRSWRQSVTDGAIGQMPPRWPEMQLEIRPPEIGDRQRLLESADKRCEIKHIMVSGNGNSSNLGNGIGNEKLHSPYK